MSIFHDGIRAEEVGINIKQDTTMKLRQANKITGKVLDDCFSCIFFNSNGTCGNSRSIMFGISTNAREHQSCNVRRYYTREAYIKPKRKRKIQSIYDYE